MPMRMPSSQRIKENYTVNMLTSYIYAFNAQRFPRSECREVAEKLLSKHEESTAS